MVPHRIAKFFIYRRLSEVVNLHCFVFCIAINEIANVCDFLNRLTRKNKKKNEEWPVLHKLQAYYPIWRALVRCPPSCHITPLSIQLHGRWYRGCDLHSRMPLWRSMFGSFFVDFPLCSQIVSYDLSHHAQENAGKIYPRATECWGRNAFQCLVSWYSIITFWIFHSYFFGLEFSTQMFKWNINFET